MLGAAVTQSEQCSRSSTEDFLGWMCQLGGRVEENTKNTEKSTSGERRCRRLLGGGGNLEARRREQKKKTCW